MSQFYYVMKMLSTAERSVFLHFIYIFCTGVPGMKLQVCDTFCVTCLWCLAVKACILACIFVIEDVSAAEALCNCTALS